MPFEFLGEQDQPQSSEQGNKVFIPQGWRTRRKGEDFWRNEETWANEGDELKPPDDIPVATEEEMKPYSQRRGEAVSKIIKTAEAIINKHATDSVAGQHLVKFPAEIAEKYRNEVRANPENAPKIIEKFYQTLENERSTYKPSSGIGSSIPRRTKGSPYDPEFDVLENSVRSYRSMLRGPEERDLSGVLGERDRQKSVTELQNLRGQLDTLTKDIATAKDTMPEAVSRRGEEEQRKTIGSKQQQAAAIAEHIKQLEKVTGQNQRPADEAVDAPVQPPQLPAPTTEKPVSAFMDGLGVNEEALRNKLHTALTKIGIPREQWGSTNVNTTAGLLRVLSELDPNQEFAQMVVQQMSLAKQDDVVKGQQTSGQGQQGPEYTTDPGIARTQRAIEGREARMRQLYSQLQESPFMHTWPGIILYVLVGLITKNPALAASLIGGVWNRDAVNNEIKGIQFDLRRLDRELQWRERSEMEQKREAARRLQQQQDQADRFKHDFDLVAARAIARSREAQGRAQSQEDKETLSNMRHDLQMYQGQIREINDQLDAIGDPFKDRYGFSSDEMGKAEKARLRQSLINNLNVYKQKAERLAQIIEKVTGSDQLLEEADKAQGQPR